MNPNIIIEKARVDVPTPGRATEGAAGYDLHAWIPSHGHLTLGPGQRLLIPTGLRMRIPPGWEAQVRPRSGLALKNGVTVLNAPGTIDSDYRGEVGVILVNLSKDDFTVNHLDRVAQVVFSPVYAAELIPGVVDQDTSRAGGGFGSTGT